MRITARHGNQTASSQSGSGPVPHFPAAWFDRKGNRSAVLSTDPNNIALRVDFAWNPTRGLACRFRRLGIAYEPHLPTPLWDSATTRRCAPTRPSAASLAAGAVHARRYRTSLTSGYPLIPALQLGLDSHNASGRAREQFAVDPNRESPMCITGFGRAARSRAKASAGSELPRLGRPSSVQQANQNPYQAICWRAAFSMALIRASNAITMIQSDLEFELIMAHAPGSQVVQTRLTLQGSLHLREAIDRRR